MPQNPNWRTLPVRKEIKTKLKQIWAADKKRPKTQKFSGYVDNLLSVMVEFQEELSRYGPFLEFRGADKTISLYDHLKNKSIEIYIDTKEKKLHCEADNKSANCLHVGFCFAIPEVYKVLIERGFKEPKI
jgi:hypothetical protein